MDKPLERIYGLDALRALTMYLGVILHSSIAYKAGHHPRYWITDPDSKSFFFDSLYFWIHSFRMPLFFMLSGFFTVLLFNKIGAAEFIKNRSKRILVPLLFCIVFLVPISVAPFTFSRLYLDQGVLQDQVWNHILNEMKNLMLFRDFKGLQHFWFLLNLIYFYSGFLILSKLGFKFDRLKFSWLNTNWIFIALTGVVTTVILLLYRNDLTPSIWTGLFPRNPQLLYYGFFYILGIYIYHNPGWLNKFKDGYLIFLIVGTVLSMINVYLVNTYLEERVFNASVAGYKFLYAFQNVFLCYGLIGFCLQHLNFTSRRTRYFSDASYWVYIIHLSIVASIQILCIVFDVYPPIRFLITLLTTTFIAYLSYHVFVRYTIIGNFLHGARNKETLREK